MAQLSWRVTGKEMELIGSYETNITENDQNRTAWTLPNVIGVRRRSR